MPMDKPQLGRSGISVSVLGLGCNNFGVAIDIDETRDVVHAALDLGVTLFDVADVYGGRGKAEEFLGYILGPKRKDIVLATKFGLAMMDNTKNINASRNYIMRAVEDSLRRLRTEWIDLY
ncbi:aryl-alcohol dehydrogenase-like predicted oxidoreductase [Nitrobacter winogradskyi]|uniref:NADP-dependent oxidoreductase domain-containing protein n=2 Tax=Nitrobacter winogradskyi TaxID=913 RepID=A0A4Y3WF72_NITWI|nr:aryl-alcohol dehydrogenase-like predicted oxidoreductase [Nitrobacter winogradskyi]GEC17667.1 hypothetical protein NWI01_35590 [Nitrobacter winogradskyi]